VVLNIVHVEEVHMYRRGERLVHYGGMGWDGMGWDGWPT
jgi:hypothetical protein